MLPGSLQRLQHICCTVLWGVRHCISTARLHVLTAACLPGLGLPRQGEGQEACQCAPPFAPF